MVEAEFSKVLDQPGVVLLHAVQLWPVLESFALSSLQLLLLFDKHIALRRLSVIFPLLLFQVYLVRMEHHV